MDRYRVVACLAGVVGLLGIYSGGSAHALDLHKGKSVLKSEYRAWWPKSVDAVLAQAGDNRAELRTALEKVPVSQREGMRFLIENMPVSDLKSLKADYLLKNVSLAYSAFEAAPWKKSIPKAVFLNEVLPYASLNEQRDDWRAMLHEKSAALIADCLTPAEAAHRLNQKLFPLLNARYSTERKKPDQSPLETIASGKATCSGLSILLVDACRSVGIPARVAGTPLWTNLRGNHTWVEIWDGDWHFLGASEPDEKGLDHGWFEHDASQARKDLPQHSIYASSFQKTGLAFPLVWDTSIDWVHAVNVTDRYVAHAGAIDASKTRLLVRVVDKSGRRVVATVKLTEKGKDKPQQGITRGEGADLNDMLSFEIWRSCPPREYNLTVNHEGRSFAAVCRCGMAAQEVVEFSLSGLLKVEQVPALKEAGSASASPVPRDGSSHPHPAGHLAAAPLSELFADRFGADEQKRAEAQKHLASITVNEANRSLAWQAYKSSAVNKKLREEWESKTVTTSDRVSPYLWRHVGQKPKDGWGLVIAMHGGGGAPKEVNDEQWKGMYERYYRDHPEVTGYVYLALRAPNDAWNGFYDDSICPLVERLIKQFVIFDDVNPDKVYTLGASHGGYGAFVIGPKIPYRFAAVHASASAPTGGETMGENLRNTRFTWMVGEQDTAYGRAERCQQFAKQVDAWRTEYGGGYPGGLEFKANTGHFVPDHDKVAELLKYTRDAWPKHVVWTQSDNVLKRFFWIEAAEPVRDGHIEATVEGNTIKVKAVKQEKLALWLDPSLVDFKKPVTVEVEGGKSHVFHVKASMETYCEGLDQTADQHMASPVRVIL